MAAPSCALSNALLAAQGESSSLFSPQPLTSPSPAWANIDSSLHSMLPHSSLTPPSSHTHNLADHAGLSATLASYSASHTHSSLYDSSASISAKASFSGNVTPLHVLTPLQGPISSTSSFMHDMASAGPLPLLDLLKPAAPHPADHDDLAAHCKVSATRTASGATTIDGIDDESDENDDDYQQEDDEDESSDEGEGRSIDLEETSTTHTDEQQTNGDNGDSSEGEEDDEEDDDEDDGERRLQEWVAESQKSGASAESVLQRLLTDYDDVLPGCQRLLWKAAYSLSAQIQSRLHRQSQRRRRLPHISRMDDLLRLIQASSKIVVLTGAGISVAAGIPDFRSKGGIYPRLRREFGMSSPEAMFDLEYFKENPAIFYNFAHELWPGSHQPTVAHRFIRLLEQKGKLLRNYTQNIDALESRAGIQNVLQCHGSFASAKCMSCQRRFPGMAIHKDIMAQKIPKCPDCHPADGSVVESLEDTDEDGLDRSCRTFGVIKPEITFFGESLPESFRSCLDADRDAADLVIVMGSSLKVQPVAGMLSVFDKRTPMVLINREVVGDPDEFDLEVLGTADEVCAFITAKLGWKLPDIDPELDTFREETSPTAATVVLAATGEEGFSGTDVAAGASAATHLMAPPPTRVLAPSPQPPRPASPQFVSPNRYLFDGACNSMSSPISAFALSDPSVSCASVSASEASLSPEPISMPHTSEQQDTAMHVDDTFVAESKHPLHGAEEQHDVASAPAVHFTTPLLTPLQGPISSPRHRAARLPPLELDSSAHAPHSAAASSAAAHSSAAAAAASHSSSLHLNLTCTPTKSSATATRSPHHAGPHMKALASSLTLDLASPAHRSTTVEHGHATSSSSHVATVNVLAVKRKETSPHTLGAASSQHSLDVTPPSHSADLTNAAGHAESHVHEPMVKRRRVTLMEQQQQQQHEV